MRRTLALTIGRKTSSARPAAVEVFETDIDGGAGPCEFDFKAEVNDGSSRVRKNFNVSDINTYIYR